MLHVPRSWAEVTPAWVTEALSAHFPGVLVDHVEIGAADEGTNSRARAALSYAHGEGPRSVFIKRPGRMSHRVALFVLGALATEARLAEVRAELPVAHPMLYAGGVEWQRLASVVVMEDVVSAGGRPHNATTPLGVAAVRDGLGGLARLHARYLERPPSSSLAFLRPWHLGRALGVVSMASLTRGLQRFGAMARDGSVTDGARQLAHVSARSLGQQFRRSAVLAAAGEQTLLHGDAHLGNSYERVDQSIGFFDWQLARTGHWSHDVGYFLVSSLDVADRRAQERELLAGYLDALRRAGHGPPDWTTAWERYRATPAFGLATWLHTLSFGTLQPVDACVAMIRRFAAAYADLETSRSAVARHG